MDRINFIRNVVQDVLGGNRQPGQVAAVQSLFDLTRSLFEGANVTANLALHTIREVARVQMPVNALAPQPVDSRALINTLVRRLDTIKNDINATPVAKAHATVYSQVFKKIGDILTGCDSSKLGVSLGGGTVPAVGSMNLSFSTSLGGAKKSFLNPRERAVGGITRIVNAGLQNGFRGLLTQGGQEAQEAIRDSNEATSTMFRIGLISMDPVLNFPLECQIPAIMNGCHTVRTMRHNAGVMRMVTAIAGGRVCE